jgi:cation diffusion facilitator CzcD-associated flavoprotein CzcO
MVGVEVEFGVRLVAVEPCGTALSLHVETRGERQRITTRKLVLATGQSAGSVRNIPAVIRDLPSHLLAHTDDIIDFDALRGKRVGVLGASASGFDAASTALEKGAASAHVFCRAPDLARGTRYRWADFPGADYFHLLPDAERWRIASLYLERGNHPPATAIARAGAQRNFHLHLGSPWDRACAQGVVAHVDSGDERFEFDLIIAATGFLHHPRLAPELRALSDQIALWKDRYCPPPGQANPVLADYPYLGEALQFQEREPGACPCLANIHVINQGAMLSLLRIVGDIKFLGFTAERIAAGIVRDLFLADREAHVRRLSSPIFAELTGDEYAPLVWRKAR